MNSLFRVSPEGLQREISGYPDQHFRRSVCAHARSFFREQGMLDEEDDVVFLASYSSLLDGFERRRELGNSRPCGEARVIRSSDLQAYQEEPVSVPVLQVMVWDDSRDPTFNLLPRRTRRS